MKQSKLLPKVGSAGVSEGLLGSTEQLEKDSLLDIFVLVDRGSDRSGQSLVDVALLAQFLQLLHTLRRETMVLSVELIISETQDHRFLQLKNFRFLVELFKNK